MRGLTQRLEDARSYRGAWLRPSNFESFWQTSVAFAQNAHVESVVELPSVTQAATFKHITFTSTDQTQLRARVILPAGVSVAEPLTSAELSVSAKLPAVVLFSDLGRGVRSCTYCVSRRLACLLWLWRLGHAKRHSKTPGGER